MHQCHTVDKNKQPRDWTQFDGAIIHDIYIDKIQNVCNKHSIKNYKNTKDTADYCDPVVSCIINVKQH